jgi:hypothetical protein
MGQQKNSTSSAMGWLFNSLMKTEVWALVGIVAIDYSDTTSDSSIHWLLLILGLMAVGNL